MEWVQGLLTTNQATFFWLGGQGTALGAVNSFPMKSVKEPLGKDTQDSMQAPPV